MVCKCCCSLRIVLSHSENMFVSKSKTRDVLSLSSFVVKRFIVPARSSRQLLFRDTSDLNRRTDSGWKHDIKHHQTSSSTSKHHQTSPNTKHHQTSIIKHHQASPNHKTLPNISHQAGQMDGQKVDRSTAPSITKHQQASHPPPTTGFRCGRECLI